MKHINGTSHLVWMTFPAKTSTVLGSSQHHEELKPQQVVALGPEELRQEQRKADRQARRWATGVRCLEIGSEKM